MIRLTSIAQPTSPSLALSIPTKKNPNPTADTIARPAPRAVPPVSPPPTSSREASTTPVSASSNPAYWTAEGRSPLAIPTITGTIAEVAAIGATTPMLPTASPR